MRIDEGNDGTDDAPNPPSLGGSVKQGTLSYIGES